VDLLSEEEQWEALKRWLRVNVPSIALMVLVLLGGYFGWKWWQSRGDQKALQANTAYEKILETFDANKIDDAVVQIEALRTAQPNSPYVASADLAAARVFVARNELDKAAQRLERVANSAPDKQLRPVATLRLARVMSAQGQYDKALAMLGAVATGVHAAAFAEARGDVLLAKGDRNAALKAYETARKGSPAEEQGVAGVGELLELKINDLRASAVSP
jgi:predicted negative regulator of RcsB-dependent stress response